MTVLELILELQKHDPVLEVYTQYENYGSYDPVEPTVEEAYMGNNQCWAHDSVDGRLCLRVR